jgi:hypothetical protein
MVQPDSALPAKFQIDYPKGAGRLEIRKLQVIPMEARQP